MSQQIKSYAAELQATVVAIAHKAEIMKDIKEADEGYQKRMEAIKELQEELKAYVLTIEDYYSLDEEKKALEKELKQGSKAATSGTGIKPADFIAFLKAKAKEEGVLKVVEKGMTFSALTNQTK